MVAVPSTLPVPSVTATLTPVRKPGSRPIVVRAPAGAASSRSRTLAANTRTASSSAACHSRTRRSTLRCIRMRVRQAQCTVSASQRWISLRHHRTITSPIDAAPESASTASIVVDTRATAALIWGMNQKRILESTMTPTMATSAKSARAKCMRFSDARSSPTSTTSAGAAGNRYVSDLFGALHLHVQVSFRQNQGRKYTTAVLCGLPAKQQRELPLRLALTPGAGRA